MIWHRKVCWFAVALVAIALSGCGTSASPRLYTLSSSAAPDVAPALQTSVIVEPVVVPAAVDQPQMVLQTGPNQVEVEEFDRWDAPLSDNIAHAVAGDLSVLLATPNVATGALPGYIAGYTVTINIQRFESLKDQAALVDAVWVVRNAAGKTKSGRTIARETLQGSGFDALAGAHSRALTKLSEDIASAIRTDAREKTL